jgi:hypothetical protein
MSPARVHLPGSILPMPRRSPVSSGRATTQFSIVCRRWFHSEWSALLFHVDIKFCLAAPLVVICSASDIATFPLASQPDTAVFRVLGFNSKGVSIILRAARAVTRHFCRWRGPELELDWRLERPHPAPPTHLWEEGPWCLIGAPRNSQPEHRRAELSRAATPQSSRLIGERVCTSAGGWHAKAKNDASLSVPAACMRTQTSE